MPVGAFGSAALPLPHCHRHLALPMPPARLAWQGKAPPETLISESSEVSVIFYKMTDIHFPEVIFFEDCEAPQARQPGEPCFYELYHEIS